MTRIRFGVTYTFSPAVIVAGYLMIAATTVHFGMLAGRRGPGHSLLN